MKFSGVLTGQKKSENPTKHGTNLNKDDSQNSLFHLTTNWNKCYKVGPGLQNCGNTCFLNSTL